jgi:hypothetical protein
MIAFLITRFMRTLDVVFFAGVVGSLVAVVLSWISIVKSIISSDRSLRIITKHFDP